MNTATKRDWAADVVVGRIRKRHWAAAIVAANWRLRRRLPHLTAYASGNRERLGLDWVDG